MPTKQSASSAPAVWNGKRRVMAAANHQPADRTAITFDAQPELYEALYKHFGLAGKPQLYDRLHVDTWFAGPRRSATYDPARGSLWGYRTREVDYGKGKYPELCFSPLAGKDELSDLAAHRWPTLSDQDFSHVCEDAAAQPERAIIGHYGWGAWFIASFMRGMDNLLLDFALRRDYAEQLIGRISEITDQYLDALLVSAGDSIDIVYVADDYCHQLAPLFSPDDFRHFVFPYLRRIADRVHRSNKKFLLHCCGAVRPLLPMIIEAGVDMLEPIQVTAAGMDPAGLKRDFGRDLCFYGGLDLQEVLCRRTPQGVADEARRLIDILGQDGGYILGPGHTYIQVDAPIENIVAMYDTAESYRPWQAR